MKYDIVEFSTGIFAVRRRQRFAFWVFSDYADLSCKGIFWESGQACFGDCLTEDYEKARAMFLLLKSLKNPQSRETE